MRWSRRLVTRFNNEGWEHYGWKNERYTIDVSIGRDQGFPASNQVNVFSSNYGGWILRTPKNFKTIKDATAFVTKAKMELAAGREGKKVPFQR